jgi:phosphatidate cytidylyltransferase
MLRTRILTALILGPLVIAAFLFGSRELVVMLLLFCTGTCVWEACGILIPAFEREIGGVTDGTKKHLLKVRIFCLAIMGWIFLSHVYDTGGGDYGTLVVALLVVFSAGILTATDARLSAAKAFGMLLSILYGTLPWLLVFDLYGMAENSAWIILVMGITWFGDTGGYFGGRFFGQKIFGARKFAPSISPKKTWEGAVFGLLMGIAGALIVNACFGGALGSHLRILSIGILGGIFAQIGDLVASSMKRFAGVKDSGIIIPGHGGFLDRVDGIVFCAPMVWFLSYYENILPW